jgi:hypothetical protein
MVGLTTHQPCGFRNSANSLGQVFYAARSYSLMRPPRTVWGAIPRFVASGEVGRVATVVRMLVDGSRILALPRVARPTRGDLLCATGVDGLGHPRRIMRWAITGRSARPWGAC